MNAIIKQSGILSALVVLAVGIIFGTFSMASAALTIATTSITTDGAYTVTTVAGSTVNLFAANTTGVITIGGTAQTGNLVIGTSSGTMNLNLGIGTGATTVNVATGGTGVNTVNIATGAIGNLVTIGSVTAAASLNLLFGTGDFTIDGAAAGTIGIGDAAQTGTITIGDSSGTLAIDFGTGEGATTIGIGTGATNANTINIGTGAVANVITIGSATGGLRYYAQTSSPAGDTTITAAQTGSTFFVGAAGDDFTLPAPAAGLNYRFIMDTLFATTNMTIVTNSSSNVIEGSLLVAGAVVACANEDTVSFVATAELPGDHIEVFSDGTSWFVRGEATTAGGITCTQAS
ncbi:MAG: hypothetical protein JKX80_01640 [Candidatus Pacebacteria bacterium]|nr:hypothetical protein [Candidatus Paceibacterota bacterium]